MPPAPRSRFCVGGLLCQPHGSNIVSGSAMYHKARPMLLHRGSLSARRSNLIPSEEFISTISECEEVPTQKCLILVGVRYQLTAYAKGNPGNDLSHAQPAYDHTFPSSCGTSLSNVPFSHPVPPYFPANPSSTLRLLHSISAASNHPPTSWRSNIYNAPVAYCVLQIHNVKLVRHAPRERVAAPSAVNTKNRTSPSFVPCGSMISPGGTRASGTVAECDRALDLRSLNSGDEYSKLSLVGSFYTSPSHSERVSISCQLFQV
jgi:hypothetical protein